MTTIDFSNSHMLMVGINYWPEETGNAPYSTGLAEHLSSLGARVTVVAGMPYYPSWSIAGGYDVRLRSHESRSGVSIHRFRQYIPARQDAVRRIGFETTFLVNAMTARGIQSPDLVIGIVPSLSDGVLAALAAKRYRAPLSLIVQDLVGQAAAQSGMQGGKRVAAATSRIEGWFARRADSIGIVAEGFRPPLVDMGVAPDRIHRVRNWTHIEHETLSTQDTRERLGLPLDARIVLHAGNMGLKQGLENVVDCARLAMISYPSLVFVLMGDGNQRAVLEVQAAGMSNVRFVEPQDDEMFPNLLAAADVLLINQRPSVTDMSLPSKLTSYFSTGRPVVAAVAAASECAREITSSGGGIVTDPSRPQDMLAAILELTTDPARAACIGQRAKRYAEEMFSSEHALARLSEVIALAASSVQPKIQEAVAR
ncbi:MAG: WcaI family glycosyltransferase [Thermomicrobiales bacterium]